MNVFASCTLRDFESNHLGWWCWWHSVGILQEAALSVEEAGIVWVGCDVQRVVWHYQVGWLTHTQQMCMCTYSWAVLGAFPETDVKSRGNPESASGCVPVCHGLVPKNVGSRGKSGCAPFLSLSSLRVVPVFS